jgi:hypothetical protein
VANAQEADERAVDAIAGERGFGGLEQSTCEPDLACSKRYLATRGEYARPHGITGRESALRTEEQLLRRAILAELCHRHPTQRKGSGVLTRADESQRGERVETREMSRCSR